MSSDLPLSPEDVAEIVAILEGSAYEKLEIRTSRFTLKVAREGGGWTQDWSWDVPAVATAPAEAAASTPKVEVGDSVDPETVVAIIETMKLMNPVHAGAHGTIEAILYDNAAPVEAEAVLMIVRPPT